MLHRPNVEEDVRQSRAGRRFRDLDQVERLWRARGLFHSSLAFAALLAVLCVVNHADGMAFATLVCATGIPLMLGTALLASRGADMPAWAPWPAAIYLATILGALLTRVTGDGDSALMWLVAVPPVAIKALGRRGGLAMSAVVLGVMLACFAIGEHLLPPSYQLRMVFAYLIAAAVAYAYDRGRNEAMLAAADARREVDRLEGLLRICGWCHKRIQDERGGWVATETYLQQRAPVRISHTICPDCHEIAAADMERRI